MTIVQLITFATEITTNARALICFGLYGSVAKRIRHTACKIPCLSRKELESREEQILHIADQP